MIYFIILINLYIIIITHYLFYTGLILFFKIIKEESFILSQFKLLLIAIN